MTNFKVGDRVEVSGYDITGYARWNGPGTVRLVWPGGASVTMDNPTGSGFQSAGFDFRYLRPLKVEAPKPRKKLSELGLGAVIRDNTDGALLLKGEVPTYEPSADPFDLYKETGEKNVLWLTTGGRPVPGRVVDDFEVLFEGVDGELKDA